MNPYLENYVSWHLHSYVRRYKDGDYINIIRTGNLVDFSDDLIAGAVISSPAFSLACPDIPFILQAASSFCYAHLSVDHYDYMVGPVRFSGNVYMSHTISLSELGLDDDAVNEDWLLSVPLCSLDNFIDMLLLLSNCGKSRPQSGDYLEAAEIIRKNCIEQEFFRKSLENMTETIFNNLESGIKHNPYSQELRERRSITEGDLDGLKKAIDEDFTGHYGRIGKDPLRQEINMGIVTMTLATRAAIDGGLHPEQAFYICDLTIQQMEAAPSPETVKLIYRNEEFHLAEMVRGIKQNKNKDMPVKENRHISNCKDYIFAHLHDKLTVADVADAVGLEKSYLSALFSRCEHMTIKQFITQEKMKLVKNMLIYSSYSFLRIAVYLGFSSQSHLGAEFKKATGMTLKAFRDAYAKEDFIKDRIFLD